MIVVFEVTEGLKFFTKLVLGIDIQYPNLVSGTYSLNWKYTMCYVPEGQPVIAPEFIPGTNGNNGENPAGMAD